ncbi:hypothetical protein MMC30_001063 [Trapelia coarctata]|nr:hypothetical protein [Trapelia coarctata]
MSALKGPGEAQSHDGKCTPLRIAILHARWNTPLISALVAGARRALLAANVHPANITTQSVPGSYELPYAVQRLYAASQIQSSTSSAAAGGLGEVGDLLSGSISDLAAVSVGKEKEGEEKKGGQKWEEEGKGSTAPFDAIIAIGVLIKGETMHFEYIADAVTHGLMRVQLDAGVPVVFGLLTVLDEGQGKGRAGLVEGSHNHGKDWGNAAVELGVKRRAWGEGKML